MENANEEILKLKQTLRTERIDNALNIALIKAQAHNTAAARALIADDIEADENGAVKELETLINNLKTENPWLFETKEPEAAMPISTGRRQGRGQKLDTGNMSDSEYYEYVKNL